jgi:hypothetical protein
VSDCPTNEIEFPSEPGALVLHELLHVAASLVTPQGERPLLAGRLATSHVRPTGVILHVRPPLQRPWPVKRGDRLLLRMSRAADRAPLDTSGFVSWVRERAYLPSGVGVSFIGVTFDEGTAALESEIARLLG